MKGAAEEEDEARIDTRTVKIYARSTTTAAARGILMLHSRPCFAYEVPNISAADMSSRLPGFRGDRDTRSARFYRGRLLVCVFVCMGEGYIVGLRHDYFHGAICARLARAVQRAGRRTRGFRICPEGMSCNVHNWIEWNIILILIIRIVISTLCIDGISN